MMVTVLASDGVTVLEQYDDGTPAPVEVVSVRSVVAALRAAVGTPLQSLTVDSTHVQVLAALLATRSALDAITA